MLDSEKSSSTMQLPFNKILIFSYEENSLDRNQLKFMKYILIKEQIPLYVCLQWLVKSTHVWGSHFL